MKGNKAFKSMYQYVMIVFIIVSLPIQIEAISISFDNTAAGTASSPNYAIGLPGGAGGAPNFNGYYPMDINSDQSIALKNYGHCSVGKYRLPINESYNGKALDMLVEVTNENTANDIGSGVSSLCLSVEDGALKFILAQSPTASDPNRGPDGIAGTADDSDPSGHMNITLTVVEQNTNTPVSVDRLTITGFDLDIAPDGSTGTDDVYFTATPNIRAYLSNQTNVTLSGTQPGSFFPAPLNGFNAKAKGKTNGNCNDTATTPDPSCRASGLFIDTSSVSLRIQNDKVGGGRYFYLSFEMTALDALLNGENDYGDTPSAYPAASQEIRSLLGLGNGFIADAGTAHKTSANADGDDNDGPLNGKFDDEDGVFLADGTTGLSGQTMNTGTPITLKVKTFGRGYLNAWIDWNHDGDFNDAGEQVLSDQFVNNTGEILANGNVNTSATDLRTITAISTTPPLNAVSGQTFARFKFTQNTAPGVGVNAGRGEVEDYAFIVLIPIIANNDTNGTPINGVTGGTVISNVSTNDTFNGSPFTLGNEANITTVTNNTPLVIDTTTGSVTVPPNTPAGTYTETYTICENLNPTNCNDANVTVTVLPQPVDDNATGVVGTPITVNILDNENNIDPSSIRLIDNQGNHVTQLIVPNEGTWVAHPSGTVTFTPLNGFTGDPTPVRYTGNDINGNSIGSDARISIDYKQVLRNDSKSGIVGNPVVLDILANDDDVNVSSIHLIAPQNAVGYDTDNDGDIDKVVVDGEGIWTVDNNGTVAFTPEDSFVESPTPIEYNAKDSLNNTITSAKIVVNYQPSIAATDDGVITITRYGATDITDKVLGNDAYDGNITVAILEQPEYGNVEVIYGDDGRPTILYSPDPDINRVPDVFRYSITDRNAQTADALVRLDVQCSSSQTSDGGDAMGTFSIFIMMLLTILSGIYFVRKEEKEKYNENNNHKTITYKYCTCHSSTGRRKNSSTCRCRSASFNNGDFSLVFRYGNSRY